MNILLKAELQKRVRNTQSEHIVNDVKGRNVTELDQQVNRSLLTLTNCNTTQTHKLVHQKPNHTHAFG